MQTMAVAVADSTSQSEKHKSTLLALGLVWSKPVPKTVTGTPPEMELKEGLTAVILGITVCDRAPVRPIAYPKPATNTSTT